MDVTRFDTFARLFARRKSRRAAVAGGIGITAVAVSGRVVAQGATPAVVLNDPHPGADTAPANPEFLFVQPFTGGTWAPKEGEDGTYTLTLTGAAAQTVYFSDRPERVVGLSPMQDFLDGLGFTPANPPNAALVAQADSGKQEVLVIELLNPAWDGNDILTYDANVLADYGEPGLAPLARQQADYELPESFNAGSLFIDDCPAIAFECIEIDVAPAVPVGTVQAKQCYDGASGTCDLCQDPEAVCFASYPAACKKRTYDYVHNVWVTEHACTAHPA
jgi:hypothetical protein